MSGTGSERCCAVMQAKGLDMRPVAPPYVYAAVPRSSVVATTCQYEALKYLYFPLQTDRQVRQGAALHDVGDPHPAQDPLPPCA